MNQAISVGDVCVQLGAAWFIVFSMPRRQSSSRRLQGRRLMNVRDATEDIEGPEALEKRPLSVGNVSAGNASVTALEAVLIIPLACWLCWQATLSTGR